MLNNIRVQEFRILAIIEGLSYLSFGITMPLKYYYELGQPNYVVGMIHGIVFMLYCLYLLVLTLKKKWSWPKGILFFTASLIPFGTFYIDSKYLKNKV